MQIEHLEDYGWKGAIRGMRNPIESWDKGDTTFNDSGIVLLGVKDLELATKLVKAGPSHRKFLRQIHISVDIRACLKWWDEFDTYEYTTTNSTSQMHNLGKRLLNIDDFNDGIDADILSIVNSKIEYYQEVLSMDGHPKHKKDIAWRNIIDNIPQSFLYTRTANFNYETFLTMYHNRKNHKMFEWRYFCDHLSIDLPYMKNFINILEDSK